MCLCDGDCECSVIVIECGSCTRKFNRQLAKLIVGSSITVCPNCASKQNTFALSSVVDIGTQPVKH